MSAASAGGFHRLSLCVISFGDVIDECAWDRFITPPRSVHPGGPPFLWATCLSNTLDGPKARASSVIERFNSVDRQIPVGELA